MSDQPATSWRFAAPAVPMSLELIEQHGKLHASECPAGNAETFYCPCGLTLAIACTDCRSVVFWFVWPGTWCEHAASDIGGQR